MKRAYEAAEDNDGYRVVNEMLSLLCHAPY
jgi:hypothetical protein